MRIVLISTPFVAVPPQGYGGTEAVVAGLAEGLAARGHDVVVYATGDSRGAGRVRACFPTAVWPPHPARELTQVAWAADDLAQLGAVDVVHAHLAPALLIAPRFDAPLVYTVHHGPDPAYDELYAQLARAATFVAISARQRDLLPPACEARVVHHGLPADRFPVGHGGGGYAAFVGRFAEEKGLHLAIDAARAAGVPIRVAGRCHPPDVAYVRALIDERLALPGVHCVGEVDHAEKCALMGGAVATLVPITWEEPFGLVMIESMLCGTPVLAFARGSAPEIVEDGVTGWLVADVGELRDRLAALADGRLRFDRARCRAVAETRFDRTRMIDHTLAVYADARRSRSAAPLASREAR